MVTPEHPNVKALHELILYYLRERSGGNIHLTRLIVSNIHTWYIFDAADQARHDEIVGLVEKTLRLHREFKELPEKEEAISEKH